MDTSRARRAALDSLEQPEDGVITPRYLTACVRELLAGTDTLVLTEAITNYQVVAEHLRASRPGSLLGSGGGSLGWAGGGAVGAKLACPERAVVCLTGDGSFLFGVPSSAQWVARRYGTPALTIIYDNHGWAAPKFSTLQVHPDGAAAKADDFHVSFDPEVDLPGVARAAGGAYGVTVSDPGELPGVLKDALAVVQGGRPPWSACSCHRSDPCGLPACAVSGPGDDRFPVRLVQPDSGRRAEDATRRCKQRPVQATQAGTPSSIASSSPAGEPLDERGPRRRRQRRPARAGHATGTPVARARSGPLGQRQRVNVRAHLVPQARRPSETRSSGTPGLDGLPRRPVAGRHAVGEGLHLFREPTLADDRPRPLPNGSPPGMSAPRGKISIQSLWAERSGRVPSRREHPPRDHASRCASSPGLI